MKMPSRETTRVLAVAAATGVACALAWRLTDFALDRLLPHRDDEDAEEALAVEIDGASDAVGEARVLSLVYDVRVGDRVVADVAHREVQRGDVGRVVGLVPARDGEAGRARVSFEGKGVYNYVPGQQAHRVALAADFVIGDAVTVASDGRAGVVVGLDCAGRAPRLLVDVDGTRSPLPPSAVAHAPLVGGFLTKGDAVSACAPFERVSVGDVGVVAGPCSSLGLDSYASRVLVDFGAKGRYNYTRAQLAFLDVAGGYAKEDRVVAAEDVGLYVKRGDHGVVVGRARSEGDLRVDFGDTRVVDCLAAALAHAPLVPGHPIKKGDRIVARVAYEDVSIGDTGVVLGPCDREMQAAHQRVCVLWDRTRAKNNWQPGRHIELAG